MPEQSPTALLLIDAINDLEFQGGDPLLPFALEMARRTAAFNEELSAAGIPAIYLNDTGKFALTGLSEGLRAELAPHGITVTTVGHWLA